MNSLHCKVASLRESSRTLDEERFLATKPLLWAHWMWFAVDTVNEHEAGVVVFHMVLKLQRWMSLNSNTNGYFKIEIISGFDTTRLLMAIGFIRTLLSWRVLVFGPDNSAIVDDVKIIGVFFVTCVNNKEKRSIAEVLGSKDCFWTRVHREVQFTILCRYVERAIYIIMCVCVCMYVCMQKYYTLFIICILSTVLVHQKSLHL